MICFIFRNVMDTIEVSGINEATTGNVGYTIGAVNPFVRSIAMF